jgi:bifunctional non-homologous end joining protein LigD
MSVVKIDHRQVELSNRGKIFFPGDKITKGELLDYYMENAEKIVPHLKDRPLTMHRYPDGIEGKNFFQKQASDYFPDWIETINIAKREGGSVDYVICNDAASMLYIVNQSSITLHIWLSKRKKLDNPDRLIFDFDPPDTDFKPVRDAARATRKILKDEIGYDCFVMTTGSRGLHVLVALDGSADFDQVRDFAGFVARRVADRNPDDFTTEVRKEKRKGRLFLDTARNAFGQTAVAPYSVRALPGAPVATPLDWDELSNSKLTARTYNIKNIFRRLGQKKDPWKDLGRKAVSAENMRDMRNTFVRAK